MSDPKLQNYRGQSIKIGAVSKLFLNYAGLRVDFQKMVLRGSNRPGVLRGKIGVAWLIHLGTQDGVSGFRRGSPWRMAGLHGGGSPEHVR